MKMEYISIYLDFIFTFFSSVLQFPAYKCFAALVKFVPKYIILFDAIVNVIVFKFFKNLFALYQSRAD